MVTTSTTAYMALFWITLATMSITVCSCNAWALPGDMAPYGQAGGFGGALSAAGNTFAFVGPILTGAIVDSKFGWTGAFGLCGTIAIIGAAVSFFNSYKRLEPKK